MCTIVPVDVTPTPSTRRDRLHRDKYEDAMREVIQGDAVTLEYSALLAGVLPPIYHKDTNPGSPETA